MTYNSSTVSAAQDATATQYNNLRKDILIQAWEYVTSGGSANAQTFTVDAQITAYVEGMVIPFKAGYTNTWATTGNVNSIGTKDIKAPDGTTLLPGDITAWRLYELRYDGTNLIVGISRSFISPTIIPQPVAPLNLKSTDTYDFTSAVSMATNTYEYVWLIFIPFAITINKFTFAHTSTPTDGTFNISLYSQDWQTRYFTKETATLTGNSGTVTTTLDSPVSIAAWYYYLGMNSNADASVSILYWTTGTIDGDTTGIKPILVLSWEPTIMWRLTITASTPATTFNPSSDITFEPKSTLYIRFN